MTERQNPFRFGALFAATLLCVAPLTAAPAAAAIDIPENQWFKQPPPSVATLPNFSGTYEPRGWNHMLYDPVGKRMVLYDGYVDASRPTSIYANAIWFYDPVANRLALESVSNWSRQNGVTVPLPENGVNPTPYDRHSYSCIAIVPEKNRLYLWGGANNSVPTNYLGDAWTYDFGTRKWREIMPVTHPFTVFEQTMTYDPGARQLVLYGGAEAQYQGSGKAWLFHVDSESWEVASTPNAPPARMSHSMVFDPVRRVSWVFGGGPYPNATNDLWFFDAAARTWQQVTPQGTVPPPRRFAAMAYDSRHDVVLMWGGMLDDNTRYNDTWLFRPATRQWQQLSPVAKAPSDPWNAEDLAYDPVNDVFVLHQGADFWLFRYAPSGDVTPPKEFRDLRSKP